LQGHSFRQEKGFYEWCARQLLYTAVPYTTCLVAKDLDLTELINSVDTNVKNCHEKVNSERQRSGVPQVASLIQLIQALDDMVCLRFRSEDNDERVQLCREALSLAEQDKDLPWNLARLSVMLARALGAVEDSLNPIVRNHSHLDERLRHCRIALAIASEGDMVYLEALSELACALCQRPSLDLCREAVPLHGKIMCGQKFDDHLMRFRLATNAAACHFSLAFTS
jgi:hypothetical protein